MLVPGDNQYSHSNGSNEPAVLSGFGFTLPASASIRGIKVDFARTGSGTVTDDAIALPKGNPKSNGDVPQGPADGPYTTATYGSATDTWGATWTAAEINASTFSVSIDLAGSGEIHGDGLGVTVYYCP